MVKQQDGSILTFRESVHHHFVSSMANLTTAANHRTELLRDYYEEKRKAVEEHSSGAFIFVPGKMSVRTGDFIERLLLQNIEVHVSTEEFTVKDLRNCWGHSFSEKRFPAGTFILPLAQPMRPLIMLFQEGYTVRAAEKPFQIESVAFSRGSILLRRRENPDHLLDFLVQVAGETGVTVHRVNTALSDEGPDLGGGTFRLLEPPRIGVFAGTPINFTSYGAL